MCSDTPVPMSTPGTRILVPRYDYPLKEPGLLGEMTDSRVWREKYKMRLEYLIVSES